MPANLVPKSKLETYKSKEEVIRLTAEQIIKDFNQFGLEVRFPENLNFAYDELYDQLHMHIIALMSTNHQKLYSLLYQIDLGEKKIHDSFNDNPGKDLNELITELVLEREFKKVATRIFFRENPDLLRDL